MSKLTLEQIEKVAMLSRIELQEDKKLQLVEELSSILDFVDDLQTLDVKDIEPISQVTGLKDVWREDVVVDCEISRDDLLKNTPSSKDGYVKVQKVL
jgi:aspartyl-tRNA(Asn)/glutamyl-tRNA(Gln) amidotransferase subunit C